MKTEFPFGWADFFFIFFEKGEVVVGSEIFVFVKSGWTVNFVLALCFARFQGCVVPWGQNFLECYLNAAEIHL